MRHCPAAPCTRRELLEAAVACVAAAWLAGCSDPGVDSAQAASEPSRGNSRLAARPHEPTRAEPPAPGRSPLGLGAARDGFYYVPSAYTPQAPLPLVVLLHGAGGSADVWSDYTQLAEANAVVLLAIDARARTWDGIRGSFGPDVEFLDAALGALFDRVAVDAARVVLGGFSDGASYALSIGPDNGDLFGHVMAHSPGFSRRLEDRATPRPRIFVSHGTRDRVLPVRLSREGILPSLVESGYDVTYEEFDGEHELPPEVAVAALEWALAGAAGSEGSAAGFE